MKSQLQQVILDLQSNLDEMTALNPTINQQHKEIYYTNNIRLRFKTQSGTYFEEKFGLAECHQLLLSKIIPLSQSENITEFTLSNPNYDFLVYNLQNDYIEKLILSAELYVQELRDWAANKQQIFIVLLAISCTFTLILLIALVPLYYAIE